MENKTSFLVSWSRFFITRYRISILILIAILIAGLWGVSNNQRQDFPTIPINFVFVSAVYPGASPADVEQEVLLPIEQAVSNFDGIDKIRSTSKNSFGSVEAIVEDVNKTDEIAAKLTDEISKLGLPTDVETSVQTFDATGPAMALGLIGVNGQDSKELLNYASAVRSELEASSSEIKRVEIAPSNEFDVTISLDAEKLKTNQLSFDLVKGTIQSQITSLPGGSVQANDGREKSITINAPARSVDDLKTIKLGRVTLGDIAEITHQAKDSGEVHYIGYVKNDQAFAKESVYLLIFKKDDGDVIRISDAVHKKVEEIKHNGLLPDNVDLVTGYDVAPFVNDQIDSLLYNGYLGLILILIVLLFFINLRTSIVVALVIPIVFLIGLFVLTVIGYSLNIMTLFAMILTLGILVDNAIVIAEGMVHELEKGAGRREAALIAIKKLGPAVMAATLTTIVVFIPFASIGGIVGDFLKYIPYTIMIIIGISFLVAISITPLFGRWFLKEQSYEQRRGASLKLWQKALVLPAFVHFGQNIIDRLSIGYRRLMEKIYRKWLWKMLVILLTLVLLGTSFGYFAPLLTFEEFPTKDGEQMQAVVSFPAGTTAEEKKDVLLKIQNQIISLPYFKTFYTFSNTIYASFTQPVNRTDDTTIHEIKDKLDQKLGPVRDEINKEINIRLVAASYGPPEAEYDIVIELLGTDRNALTNAANDVEAFLNKQSDVVKIYNSSRDLLVPSVDVNLNQAKLVQQGVDSLAAAGTVNAIFAPQKIGKMAIRDDGVSDDVIIEFSESSTDSVDDLQNLKIPSATRGLVKLSNVADINEVSSPIIIKRLNSRRVATLGVSLTENADRAAIDKKIKDYLTEDKLVALGLSKNGVVYGGEFADFATDFSRLQIVFILAVLAVYLILVYQFYSYWQPALIMFAVPLALIGVFPGLLIVGSTLNMISGLGVIALVGVVVNDAIVFIATFNRYRKEFPSETLEQTLTRAGFTRFKPIFSTSITTIGGILPLTLLDPFWTGLGTSIIAGLTFSTIGTLIAIPVLYSISCSLKSYINTKILSRIFKRRQTLSF